MKMKQLYVRFCRWRKGELLLGKYLRESIQPGNPSTRLCASDYVVDTLHELGPDFLLKKRLISPDGKPRKDCIDPSDVLDVLQGIKRRYPDYTNYVCALPEPYQAKFFDRLCETEALDFALLYDAARGCSRTISLLQPEHQLTLSLLGGDAIQILHHAVLTDCEKDLKRRGPIRHIWLLLLALEQQKILIGDAQRVARLLQKDYDERGFNFPDHLFLDFIIDDTLVNTAELRPMFDEARAKARAVIEESDFVCDEEKQARYAGRASETMIEVVEQTLTSKFWQWYEESR